MATVLLVEDDPAARQGLELALRRLDYGVHAAGTPARSGVVRVSDGRVFRVIGGKVHSGR